MKSNLIFVLLLFGLGIQFMYAQPAMWQNALAIRQGLNIEWSRAAAAGPDGTMVIVWSDTRYGVRDIWAQKVDVQGNYLWGTTPLLINNNPGIQERPIIIKTTDNAYIIAWIDYSFDSDGDIYAQKISNAGLCLWQQTGVPICVQSDEQSSISGCEDNSGGAFINWVDNRNPSKDIYASHILANGTTGWITNGKPIANSVGDETQNTILADGYGGFIIAYKNHINHQDDLYMNRFDVNGTLPWGGARILSDGPNEQSSVKAVPDGTGAFIFTWQDNRNNDFQIYAMRVGLDGHFLWEYPVLVYAETGTPPRDQRNPQIIKSGDRSVIIVWEDNRNNYEFPDLYIQKLSIRGSLEWAEKGVPVSIAPYYQRNPRMIADGNGGCFITWDDTRNGDYPNVDIYAQHIFSNSTMTWERNGRAICNLSGEQSYPVIASSGNDLFISWSDFRDGSCGLYYQVLNSGGSALLELNGKKIIWGLSGDAVKDSSILLTRGNDAVVIWEDTRASNFGYQIFFQIVQPDGTFLMPMNGKQITTFTGHDQQNPSAVVTSEGNIAITWVERHEMTDIVCAQLLDYDGNYLWGDTGISVTENITLMQRDPKISYEDGALYVGWSNADQITDYLCYRVWGQKLSMTGSRLWGPNGKLISATPAGENIRECLMQGLVGRYFVWLTSLNILYTKLVNPATGDAMPGWNINGNRSSKYIGDDLLQLSPIVSAASEGLIVIWEDLRGDFVRNLYAQKYNFNGTLAWDSLGVVVGDYGREQDLASLYVTGDAAYIPWRENIDGFSQDIAMQKLSMTGQHLWGTQGTFVFQEPNTQSSPTITQIFNNYLLVAWEDYNGPDFESDIYMQCMTPDGEPLDNVMDYLVSDAPKSQYNPKAISIDDRSAFLLWSDARSSDEYEIMGLYMQYLDYAPIKNNDLFTPSPIATLNGNYPNPFNPETTISFSLYKPGKANLEIFNIKGQKVRTLLNEEVSGGKHDVIWNGKNDEGKNVGSGIYFFKLKTGSFSSTKKMILLK